MIDLFNKMNNNATTNVWKAGKPFIFPKWYFDKMSLSGNITNSMKTIDSDLTFWDILSDEALNNFENELDPINVGIENE